jgi:2-oxoisovalerate/pyruvate ferredoxin oxidoreductase gamma subunit
VLEIRFNGRGGQGAVSAAEIMVEAIAHEGKYAQAFPWFGGERRGAPVQSFLRVDDKPVRIRQMCYTPDVCVILDTGLARLIPWYTGLKEGGIAVLNWDKAPEEVKVPVKLSKLVLLNATDVSVKAFGQTAMPITNTAMLGALTKVTGMVKLENINKALEHRFTGKTYERNCTAVKLAYDGAKIIEVKG